MQKTFHALLALAFVTFSAATVAADLNPAPTPAAVPSVHGEQVSRLESITAQLNLTDDQKAKIAPIVRQEAADLRALKAEAKAARIEKMRRFKAINEKASGEIRVLLTPEQQQKYDELRAAAKAEFKQKLKTRRAAAGG